MLAGVGRRVERRFSGPLKGYVKIALTEPADAPEEAPAAEEAEAAAAEEKPPCPPGVRDTVGEGNPNQGGWGHSCAWVGDAYAPGWGEDDNGMFGYGAQGDDGYEYSSQDDGAGAWGDDGYEYGAQGDDGDADAATGDGSNFYDDGSAEAEAPAAQPAAAEPEPAVPEDGSADEPPADEGEPEPTFEQPAIVAEAVAVDVNADTIDYEAKWAPMEVVIALFIFVTCAFSMTRLCRAKEDQYAPVTRAISEEDLVAPEDDVERGPTLEDKRRMLD